MRTLLLIACLCTHCSLQSVSVILKALLAEKWFEIEDKYSPKEKQELMLRALIQ